MEKRCVEGEELQILLALAIALSTDEDIAKVKDAIAKHLETCETCKNQE